MGLIMKTWNVILFILLSLVIFAAGFFAESLVGRGKISELQKLTGILRQEVHEANQHAADLQNHIDQIKTSVTKLESINNELKTETRVIEKNLHRVIDSVENIESGIKSASLIVSNNREDIDELGKIIEGIKNRD